MSWLPVAPCLCINDISMLFKTLQHSFLKFFPFPMVEVVSECQNIHHVQPQSNQDQFQQAVYMIVMILISFLVSGCLLVILTNRRQYNKIFRVFNTNKLN